MQGAPPGPVYVDYLESDGSAVSSTRARWGLRVLSQRYVRNGGLTMTAPQIIGEPKCAASTHCELSLLCIWNLHGF